MKKWISFMGIVIAVLLISIATGNVKNQAVFNTVNTGTDHSVQTLHVNDKAYMFVWDNVTEKCKLVPVGDTHNSFRILQAIAGTDIYYQYSYEKAEGSYYGIGCYDPDEGETKVLAEWRAEVENWLAFGLKEESGRIFFAEWIKEEKQINEYEASIIATEFEWTKVRTATLDEPEFVFGYYDNKQGLNVCTYDNEIYRFALGSSNYKKSNEIIEVNKKVTVEAPAKWKSEYVFLKTVLLEDGIYIGGLVLILFLFMLGVATKRSLVIKTYSIAELVLLLVIVLSCIIGVNLSKTSYHQLLTQSVMGRLEYLAKDYAENKEFNRSLAGEEIQENYFAECILVNTEDKSVIKAVGLSSKTPLIAYFKGDELGFIDEAVTKNISYGSVLTYQGTSYLAIAFVAPEYLGENEILLGIVDYPEIRAQYEQTNKKIVTAYTLTYFIASFLITVILLLYQKRWQRFVDTAHAATLEGTGYAIPQKEDSGMGVMWGSLQEMSKNVEKLAYERRRSIESFSRFVPSGLDKLFEKENLGEVSADTLINKKGALVQISMESIKKCNNNVYLAYATKNVEYLYEKLKQYQMTIFGTDPDNLKAKCFFEGDVNEAVAFAVEMSAVYRKDTLLSGKEKTIFLNHSQYCCGIAGSEKMAVPFVYSVEDDLLMTHEEELRRAGVKMVMTDAVLNQLSSGTCFVRYIGYVRDAATGRSLKLYECLDAYADAERKRMINALPFFEKALDLFYSDDFYLARNTFNKVLQMNSSDQIARWYLFNCEYYLNKTDKTEVSYALYDNPIIEQLFQK